MPSPKIVCITSGDSDGIGLEVSLAALVKLGPQKNLRFVLFLSDQKLSRADAAAIKSLQKKFRIKKYSSFDDFLLECDSSSSSDNLILIHSSLSPAQWVEISAKACLKGQAHALCTAPLSKPGIRAAGMKDLGHTEILQRVCQVPHANMCFLGKSFNVILATGHLPLADVSKSLNEALLRRVFAQAELMKSFLPASARKKPLGVLGLNPHAGDKGLIGDFEQSTLNPLLEKFQREGIETSLALVPDVAFHPLNWKKFSFYVALYHDQGLIPFKLVHGFGSGVHLTLGLPICRTSVDHGTAKDIYGKGLADPGSMKDALAWAIRLAKGGGWKGIQHV